jgi:hypothetical protein
MVLELVSQDLLAATIAASGGYFIAGAAAATATGGVARMFSGSPRELLIQATGAALGVYYIFYEAGG